MRKNCLNFFYFLGKNLIPVYKIYFNKQQRTSASLVGLIFLALLKLNDKNTLKNSKKFLQMKKRVYPVMGMLIKF